MGFSLPTSWLFSDGNFKLGVSASVESGEGPWFLILQGDWYNVSDFSTTQSILANVGVGKQFANKFGIYAGAGLGTSYTLVGFDFSDFFGNFHFAWKAFGGVRFLVGRLVSMRADVSYINGEGVVLAFHAGFMF